jgi:hypothetical protein
MENDLIVNAVKKMFESLYAKGMVEYDVRTFQNKKWFVHRDDGTANIIEFNIMIDIDKISPLSKDYDPEYRKILQSLEEAEQQIKTYLGDDKMVVVLEYEWSGENEKYTKLNTDFQQMTIEMAQNFIDHPDNQRTLSTVLKGDITAERFFEKYEFSVTTNLWDSVPIFNIEVLTDVIFCNHFNPARTMNDFILPVLDKYGFKEGEYTMTDNMCSYDNL